jgi:PAS domain S-box-containing protein
MSEGQVPSEFRSLPMNSDVNSFDGGLGNIYPPLSTSAQNFEPQSANLPLSGAGPSSLPADPPVQPTAPARSTLTDFTKKKDIPQRVVEELSDFLHILTPDGRILYLSSSGKSLTGYPQDELHGKFIIDFIHPDDSGLFMREFNESITSGSSLHLFYRFRKRDGTYTIFECRGHPHFACESTSFDPNSTVRICGGYFMSAFPYPSKNAALLDSFLEHKLENERLTKRINDLKKEEAEEAKEEERQWQRKQNRRSSIPFEEIGAGGRIPPRLSLSSQPQLTGPGAIVTLPLAQQPLPIDNGRRGSAEGSQTTLLPDLIPGNANHYNGATHMETIELLTGLNYQDGERSRGLSTGDQSPILVRGDAGIAMPINREPKATDKKKKIKLPEEYVCTDCGRFHCPTSEIQS